jgi:hypothetical protein
MPKGKSIASGIGGELQERKEKQELTAKRTKLTKFFADPAIRVGAACCVLHGNGMAEGFAGQGANARRATDGRPSDLTARHAKGAKENRRCGYS